jgi:CRP/FNR family transcriptional regulator
VSGGIDDASRTSSVQYDLTSMVMASAPVSLRNRKAGQRGHGRTFPTPRRKEPKPARAVSDLAADACPIEVGPQPAHALHHRTRLPKDKMNDRLNLQIALPASERSPGLVATGSWHCSASELLRWAAMPEAACAATDAIVFPLRRVHPGQSLVLEGQPFDTLHVVNGGSFKYVRTDVEGYEQVLGFALHGDFIGLDGLGQASHTAGAVALEVGTVAALPLRELLACGRRVPALESLLHRAVGAEVLRRGDTQYLMSAPSSEVRVARFLLQLAQRQAALGHSQRRLRLCMTRRDIGSYLGVAHETVSRALTALVKEGCIRVSHRDIELVDLEALHELQRVTRGRTVGERHAGLPGRGVQAGSRWAGTPAVRAAGFA